MQQKKQPIKYSKEKIKTIPDKFIESTKLFSIKISFTFKSLFISIKRLIKK